MLKLQDFNFKTTYDTYVIAEIGINHGGSLKKALEIVKSASKTGCDAVKFQTYDSEKRAPKKKFPDLHEILKSCQLKFSEFSEIKNYCDDLEIEFISTAFDRESIEFLESINMNIFKISSFDLINLELIKKISSLGKTNIFSVGMGSKKEIIKASQILESNPKCKNAILHCVSSYPTQVKDSNIVSINYLKNNFKDFLVGLSDHTPDIKVPSYAVALGARIIEKHYKIDEHMDCIDSSVSITQNQMKDLVSEIRFIEKILGTEKLDVLDSEKDIVKYRRSNTL